MKSEEQLELMTQFDEDQLFTAALQLTRRIYDDVVEGNEEAVHGDLPSAIDDLSLGPWHELEHPLDAVEWPYPMKCRLLNRLLARLETVSSSERGTEAVVTARGLLRPSATPLWARG